MSTVAAAKAAQKQQQTAGPLAMIEQYRPDLSIVLPSHVRPDTWIRVAMGAARKSTQLWQACNDSPSTMMAALYEAARLGLEPGTDEYYLTPRRNKEGRWEVLGIVGYRGEVELMYRGGAVSSVIVCDVREGDTFRWRPGDMDRPMHAPRAGDGVEWFDDETRGQVIGAYAYALMKDGGVSNVVIAGQQRIKRAMAASATAGTSYSPWKTDYRAMVLKTAAHDLEPWVPTSAEFREALREDARATTSVARPVGKSTAQLDVFLPPPGIVDGEIVDPAAAGEVPPVDAGVGHEVSPAEPPSDDPADASSHQVSQTQMRRIFALLKKRGIGEDGRLAAASMALDRDVVSFKDLTANDASKLITRLEQAGADLGAPAPDTTPQSDDDTQGDQP
jgi:recombination protein RecT